MHEQVEKLLSDAKSVSRFVVQLPALKQSPRLRGVAGALDAIPKGASPDQLRKAIVERPELEKIVQLTRRPALLVQGDSFEAPIDEEWRDHLEAARRILERVLHSVGRVELRDPPLVGMVGTAWVIARGVAVTNRHVAEAFSRRRNGAFTFKKNVVGKELVPDVDFLEEYRTNAEPEELRVKRVLYVEPDEDDRPDVAFLELEGGDGSPAPIPLATVAPAPGRRVVAIGYPAYDPNELNQEAMHQIFAGVYEVKRLSPGYVLDGPSDVWYFRHDCTTLGGSSGSLILDLETGTALGLHFQGTSSVANYAVSADALRELLRQHGLEPEVPAIAAPAGEAERARRPEEYEARDGFAPGFLGEGAVVDLPWPVADRAKELATLKAGGSELKYRHFSVLLNGARKLPMVTAVNVDGTALRRIPRARGWAKDPRVDAALQAGDPVYRESGLSRGHMVRRLDPVWGELDEAEEANADTFHFTNACPQEQVFNDTTWGDLEDYILDSAAEDGRLSVFTGPILEDGDPPVAGIQVPRRFWKIVAWMKAGTLRAAGFRMSQAENIRGLEFNPSPFAVHQVSVAEIGRDAGIDFKELLAADVTAREEARFPPRLLRSAEEMRI